MPKWDEIKRCPIWKAFSIVKCNQCDTIEHCWGKGVTLPVSDKAMEAIDKVIKAVKNDIKV